MSKYYAGRPRTTTPSDEELEALGEEMLAWIDAQDEILHLSQWYTIEKGFLYNEWKAFIQKPTFLPYYEIALKKMGLQYIKKDSPIEPALKQRWQRVYFKDLREQEDQDKDDDVKRQKDVAAASTTTVELKLDKMTQEIAEARAALAKRRASESLS